MGNKVNSKEDCKSYKYIPFIVHGDGVEFVDDDSLEVFNMGPLLGTGDSMDCMFLSGVWPSSAHTQNKAHQGWSMRPGRHLWRSWLDHSSCAWVAELQEMQSHHRGTDSLFGVSLVTMNIMQTFLGCHAGL